MRDLTIVRKNLFRKKLRFSLLWLAIFIAFLIYGVLVSVQSIFSGGSTAANPNRLVVTNKINFTLPLPISYFDRIRAMPGVAAATHTSWFGGYYKEPKNFVFSFITDFPTYFQVYPEIELPAAERQACYRDRIGLLVGKTLAAKNGWKLGQDVTLFSSLFQQQSAKRSWAFHVCGIFTVPEGRGSDQMALMRYDYFNETKSVGRDTIGNVTLVTADAARNDAIRHAIDTQFANTGAETDTVTEQQFSTAFVSQLGNIGLIVTLVVGAAFISILFIVGNTMVMAVRERTREIGIMKTLGFPEGRILRMIVGESMLVAMAGGFAGLAVAWIFIKVMSKSGMMNGVAMGPRVWLGASLWIALLGLLTAAVPAYNALRLTIVAALGRR